MRWSMIALLVIAACGSEQAVTPSEPSAPETRTAETEQAAEPVPEEPTCADRAATITEGLTAIVAAHAECTYDVDCVAAVMTTACVTACDVALHPRGLSALDDARRSVEGESCRVFAEAGCSAVSAQCTRSTPRCEDGRCAMHEGEAPLRALPVPPQNTVELSDAPPPRPSPGEAERERGRRLFEAIARDEPERASDLFFPREAFAVVKAIADPDGYWKRLYARYAVDIHALHASLGDLSSAEFERLEIIRRGGWVPIREEGNALPYWVARHNLLHYTVDGEARTFEVRVMITWGNRWYVTHLLEFR